MKIQFNRTTVVRILFFLFFLQFVLSYQGGVWYISEEKYTMMPIYTNFVNGIRLVYLLGLIMLGIYCLIKQWKGVYAFDKVFFLLFFVVTIYKLIPVADIVDTQTLLFQAGTPMMYVMLLAFFIGMDDKVRNTVFRQTKIYAVLYLMLTIFYFVFFCLEFGYSIGIRFASGPILYSFNHGVFCLIYALYQEQHFKKNKYWIVMLPICALTSIITTARSWAVQAILMILMYFVLQGKGKRVIRNVFKAGIGVLTIYLLIRIVSPGVLTTLINRMGESTRSLQLETFFKQVTISDLLVGLGYNATYVFGSWKDYQYIDNQIIFSAFRYGALITILFVYFLTRPIFLSLKCDKESLNKSLGLIHFVLALLGVSIYFNMSMDIGCIVTYLLAGRLYKDARYYRTKSQEKIYVNRAEGVQNNE